MHSSAAEEASLTFTLRAERDNFISARRSRFSPELALHLGHAAALISRCHLRRGRSGAENLVTIRCLTPAEIITQRFYFFYKRESETGAKKGPI